jgi:phage replication O-like protein O
MWSKRDLDQGGPFLLPKETMTESKASYETDSDREVNDTAPTVLRDITTDVVKNLGFTPFHHYIIEEIMPDLKGNTWKVFSFILRKTMGWNKEEDDISYSQIQDGCQMGRATVGRALDELTEKGYIKVKSGTRRNPNKIRLNLNKRLDGVVRIRTRGSPLAERKQQKGSPLAEQQKKEKIKEKKPVSLFVCVNCSQDAEPTVEVDPWHMNGGGRCPYCLVGAGWGHFLKGTARAAPKPGTDRLRKKVDKLWETKEFKRGWQAALAKAAQSPYLIINKSWFTFDFFVSKKAKYDDHNWKRVLDGAFDSFDQQYERGHPGTLAALASGSLSPAALYARETGGPAPEGEATVARVAKAGDQVTGSAAQL